MTDDRIRCQICFTGVNSVILEKKKETRIGTMQLSGQLLRVERWTPIKWRPLKSFQFGPRDGTVIALRWSGSVADVPCEFTRGETSGSGSHTHTVAPKSRNICLTSLFVKAWLATCAASIQKGIRSGLLRDRSMNCEPFASNYAWKS